MREARYKISGVPSIALLSDLHNHPFQHVAESLQRHRPSLICIAGDIIYGRRTEDGSSPLDVQEYVLPFFEFCAATAPSYMSLGNHEHLLTDRDLWRIGSTGVRVLDNTWVRNGGLVIGGLTSGYVLDERRGLAYRGGRVPETDWLTSFSEEEGVKILISHHPEYYPLIPKDIDLFLCGHAHGGQFRIFNHGLYAPGQGWWPRWTRGFYEGRMVVSAGLSNTAFVPRLFNPIEIAYINI